MHLLSFQRPEKVAIVEANDSYGKFKFGPLEPSFGVTIGNSMRRILLSSLEGFAFSSIKVDGVLHEFDTIPGVVEDMTALILNLKQVRLKQTVQDMNNEVVVIHVNNTEVLTAGDVGKQLTGFKVLNEDLVLCRMDPSADFMMVLTIDQGRGFRTSDENYNPQWEANVIPIDTIFSPITKVGYEVVTKEGFETLFLEVFTDGSIRPTDALAKAALLLIEHFSLITDDCFVEQKEDEPEKEEFDEETLRLRQLLNTPIVDLNLSVRATNCLRAAEVNTLGELVQYKLHDLLRFRNFGKKSMVEIEELLDSLGLSFGMDISKIHT